MNDNVEIVYETDGELLKEFKGLVNATKKDRSLFDCTTKVSWK